MTESEYLNLINLRDLIQKGWSEEAMKYIDSLVNEDKSLGYQVQPLAYCKAFDSDFRKLSRKHNVIACYVIIEKDLKPGNTVNYKMITGGHHVAEAVLSYHLRPLMEELGLDPNPAKPFLKLAEFLKEKSFGNDEKGNIV